MSVTGRVRSLVDVERPWLVGLLSFSHGFNEFFSIIVPPLFPFLVPSLDIGYSEASLLVVVFFLTYSVCQLLVGPLADVYDNRNILAGGMAVLAGGIALVALAPTYRLMLGGMVVAGVGGSTYHPTGMALISDAESDETYGRSMGIHGTLGSFGTVIAPLVVVGVAEVAGWRLGLLAGSVLGLLFTVLLYLAYPRVSPRAGSSPTAVAALRLTFVERFDRRETLGRVRAYLLSPDVLVLTLLFVVVGAEVRAVQTFTAAFAVETTGLGESFGGTMLSVTMVTAGLASMLAGGLVDTVDRNLFAAATFAGTGVLVAALVVLEPDPSGLTVGFVLLGAVLYSVYPAANAIAAATTASATSGSLFAVTNTAAAVGGAAGAYLLGVVADAASVEYAFLTTAGIAAVGLGISLAAAFLVDDGAGA